MSEFMFPKAEIPMARAILRTWESDVDIIEFAGPTIPTCLSHRYVSLDQNGVRKEGEVDTASKCWTAEEAWDRFRDAFRDYIRNCEQIAWRALPEISQSPDDGSWHVRARLVAYSSKQEIANGYAVG